jgi:hypothetical protein
MPMPSIFFPSTFLMWAPLQLSRFAATKTVWRACILPTVMKKFYSTPMKQNYVDDLLYIQNLLKDNTEVDLKATGLGHPLLPAQYALLSRMTLSHGELHALPEPLALLALQHPSRYPDNVFFETLLLYGMHTATCALKFIITSLL